MPFTTLKNWLRPSIQQPRWIKQSVDRAFQPILTFVTYGKDYLDTWNKVFRPENKDDKNGNV